MNQNHQTRRDFARFTIALTAVPPPSPLAASPAEDNPYSNPARSNLLGSPFTDHAVMEREMSVSTQMGNIG